MCANVVDFSIWYGVLLIQKWKSICATYNICSKVILTQIVEGPCSTNNIYFYSNYEGDIIVSLSFLVLTCKAILWQNSNLSHRKDFQCESPALFESFVLSICKQLLRFYSWAESQSHCSSVWDFQVKELPLLKQHCTKFQDKRCWVRLNTLKYRCVCQVIPWLLKCIFAWVQFAFARFVFLQMRLSLCEIRGSFAPSQIPTHTPRCFFPLCLWRSESFKRSHAMSQFFPSLRICKNSAQGLVPLYV